MKILFFCRLFYPHIGGVEKHVFELGRELIALGHTVTVVTEKHNERLKDVEEYAGIHVHRLSAGNNHWLKKFRIWRWLFRHQTLIRQSDIIHCHDVFFWYFPFRLFFLTKKVYTTFHGYEGNAIPTKRAVFMHKAAEILSSGNICVGSVLKKWYGTKTKYVTYGGVHVAESRTASRIANPQKIRAIYVGRLEEEAGIMVYLRAIQIAQARGIRIQTMILGDGAQREEAEEYAAKHALPVRFKGFVADVEKYMSDAHFVFTSRYLGILEAMNQKRFVFAVYNNPIKGDYLRMTPFASFISITKGEHALAEDIVFYAHNQPFNKITKGYAWVRQQTWESLVEQYLRLWKQ